MKIIEQNNDQLVVQHYPIVNWVFFGLFFSLGSIGLMIPVGISDELLAEHIAAGAILGCCTIFIFVVDAVKINT